MRPLSDGPPTTTPENPSVRSAAGWSTNSQGMTNPAPIEDVPIGEEVIRLGQFLEFAGFFDSGGDVKEAIIDGYVASTARLIADADDRFSRATSSASMVAVFACAGDTGHTLR